MARPRLTERRMSNFLAKPATIRSAAQVIIVATAVVVAVSGALMRLIDRTEYPSVWRGIWWAMQTITTVGYGDVTPAHVSGRIVGVAVMLWGIAFLSVVIAAVTSAFVERAGREHGLPGVPAVEGAVASIDERLDDLGARLDRIEQALDRLAGG